MASDTQTKDWKKNPSINTFFSEYLKRNTCSLSKIDRIPGALFGFILKFKRQSNNLWACIFFVYLNKHCSAFVVIARWDSISVAYCLFNLQSVQFFPQFSGSTLWICIVFIQVNNFSFHFLHSFSYFWCAYAIFIISWN